MNILSKLHSELTHTLFFTVAQINTAIANTISEYVYLRRREDLNLRNPLGVNLISSEAH